MSELTIILPARNERMKKIKLTGKQDKYTVVGFLRRKNLLKPKIHYLMLNSDGIVSSSGLLEGKIQVVELLKDIDPMGYFVK